MIAGIVIYLSIVIGGWLNLHQLSQAGQADTPAPSLKW